mmetsp:Transcript_74849/g.194654  ORF Transcript_74849/g.194654 Transcript_74849/m.194654 type:complete len:1051 (-) Transcript_74849:170-3322(-)
MLRFEIMPPHRASTRSHPGLAAAATLAVVAALFPGCHGQVVATPTPPEMLNTQCLLYHGDGCSAIRDEKTCLNSRDGRFFDLLHGRRIRGQPCVWCGGKACSEQSENKCEPYQWVVGNPLVKQPSAWQAANCLDKRSVHQTMAAIPGRAAVVGPTPGTFQAIDGGEGRACRGASTFDDGTGMIGFGGGQQWEYSIYTAASLEQCQSFCKTSCVGVEFRAADLYCEIWWDLVTSSSPKEGYQCFTKDMECLTWRSHGCSAITDKKKCLSSKDGRQTVESKYKGIDVYGSPCAWCGGGQCHDGSSSMCEPVSLLTQGEGRYFSTLFARDQYLIAKCDSDSTVGKAARGLLLPDGHSASGSGPGGIDGTTSTPSAASDGSKAGGFDSTGAASAAAPLGASASHGAAQGAAQPSDVSASSQPTLPRTTPVLDTNSALGVESNVGGSEFTDATLTVAPVGASASHGVAIGSTEGDSLAGMGEAHSTTAGPSEVSTSSWPTLPGTSQGVLDMSSAVEGGSTTGGFDSLLVSSSSSAGPLSSLPPGVSVPGGTFISSGDGSAEGAVVYWYDAAGKHPLAEGTHCSSCGCTRENIQVLVQAQIDAIPTSDPFHCVALNPSAAPITTTPSATQSPVGRFVRVAGAGTAKANADGNPTVSGGAAKSGAVSEASNGASVSGNHAASSTSKDSTTIQSTNSGGELWWEDLSGTLHAVKSGYDCSVCGCETVSIVSPSTLASMPRGTDFDCSKAPDLMSVALGEGSANGTSRTSSLKRGRGQQGEHDSWFIVIIILFILVFVAIAMCLFAKSRIDRKKELAALDGARTQRLHDGVFDDLEQMGGLADSGESSEESDDAGESPGSTLASNRDPLIMPRTTRAFVVQGPRLQAAPAASTFAEAPNPVQCMSAGPAQQAFGAESVEVHTATTQFRHGVDVAPPPRMDAAPLYGPPQVPQLRQAVNAAPMVQARAAAPTRLPLELAALPTEPLAVPREPLARGGMAGSGAVTAGGASGRPSVFDLIDRNHDGVLSRQEWDKYAFDAFDQNHDSAVSHQEWIRGRTRP